MFKNSIQLKSNLSWSYTNEVFFSFNKSTSFFEDSKLDDLIFSHLKFTGNTVSSRLFLIDY